MPGTIWKFPLATTDEQVVAMPEGSKVLSVGIQHAADIMVWALVNPSAPMVERRFWIVGTGHDFRPSSALIGRFVGTVMIASGLLVFHVFTEKD